MILTKMIYNQINYKVKLPIEFGLNLLTSSKNNACYTMEGKRAAHNRVDTAQNRMVHAEITFGAVASLSLYAL